MVVESKAASVRQRGRPPTFTEEALKGADGFSYARSVRTRRGAQDLVYRMFAVAVLEHYCEAYPEEGETLAWLLRPIRRHALLTELGRMGRPRSDGNGALAWSEADVSHLVQAALHIARLRPSTKEGVAILRAWRLDAQRRDASSR